MVRIVKKRFRSERGWSRSYNVVTKNLNVEHELEDTTGAIKGSTHRG